MMTLDFLVPKPSVSVCQAWCAKMVKFEGRKAMVEGRACGGERFRRSESSSGRDRRTVKDFTMNWPPNLRPFTSVLGLKDMFGVVVAVAVVAVG